MKATYLRCFATHAERLMPFGIINCTTREKVLFKVLLQIELLEELLVFVEAVLVVDHVQVVAQLGTDLVMSWLTLSFHRGSSTWFMMYSNLPKAC